MLACASFAAAPAWSQSAAPADSRPLRLQASPWLEEKLPSVAGRQSSTIVWGDRVDGAIDQQITATGHAELRHPGQILKADVLRYEQNTNTVFASGKVRINRRGDVFDGDKLQLQLDSYEGSFNNVDYRILKTGGLGTASRVDFWDQDHSIVHDGIYSACERDPQHPGDWKPAWYIRGKKIVLNTEQDEGFVEDGALVFGGVPVLPVPAFGFPLSDQRRSGFLTPTVTLSSTDGVQYTQPYYINIAPNRDATVAVTAMTKRGFDLYGQFRYLEDNYSGSADASFMPHDTLTSTKRWRYHWQHAHSWPHAVTGWGNLALSVDLNRVSDNTYWRDFQANNTLVNQISQRQLANTVTLSWNLGHWSAYVTEQRWQTLQLPAPDNIVPPFDKSPQVHARYARDNVKGFDFSLDLDSTRFHSDPALTGYPNGTRSYALGRVSHPWVWPWGFVTPSVEVSATHYQSDTAMPDGARSASRVLPTFTLDSGLIFERNTRLFGRNVQQTLEPRLFYAYTPYKNQDALPVYDSAIKDFNLASIFSSNPFTGMDRISNNNTLTAGLTSRFYDADNGAELARFTVAQRHRFAPRRVYLNAADTTDNQTFSDILFDGSIQWSPRWSTEASLDYDQRANTVVSGRVGMRYAPRPYRVVTANLSRQTGGNQQVDAGWQWPLNDLWGDRGQDKGPGRGEGPGRWYSVGRMFYSLTDRRVTDAMLGLEYDACCWIARVAFRRQQTQTAPVRMNNSVMLQLELNGLTRVGMGATQLFRDNVPGYTPLRQPQLSQPSRFGQYD